MKNIQYILICSAFVLFSNLKTSAQYTEETPQRDSTKSKGFLPKDFKETMQYGIAVGIPIFGYPPVDIGFQIGNKFNDKVEYGIQLNLVATPIPNGVKNTYMFYGASAYGRLFFTDYVFLTTEFGPMSTPYFALNTQNAELQRSWKALGLVGFGYKRGMFGNSSYTYATIMYQVSPKSDQPTPYVITPLVFKSGLVF